MSTFWVVSRKHWQIGLAVLSFCMVTIAFVKYGTLHWAEREASSATAPAEKRVIHMITGEFNTVLDNGKSLETYVFHPGTVPANDGETVELRIKGVNGKQHDFVIEGLDVSGTIKKNEETIITFQAKEGIYRIVCLNHSDASHEGPMVGYIVVD